MRRFMENRSQEDKISKCFPAADRRQDIEVVQSLPMRGIQRAQRLIHGWILYAGVSCGVFSGCLVHADTAQHAGGGHSYAKTSSGFVRRYAKPSRNPTPSRRGTKRVGNKAVEFPVDGEQLPASRYARLDQNACYAELARREVSWQPADPTRGVSIPVLLTGPLHGVSFQRERTESLGQIMDCRLVVALDDFSLLMEKHGIEKVIYMSAYRPPGRFWKPGRGSRHHVGLALDIKEFRKQDGTTLHVLQDFRRSAAPTCGAVQFSSATKAKELLSLVCESAKAHIFHLFLTYNYNSGHRDHFHVHLNPTGSWFLVR